MFGGRGTFMNEKVCFSTCSPAVRRDGKSLTPSFVMIHKSELTSIDHNGVLHLARNSYVCQDHHELQPLSRALAFKAFSHTYLLEVHKIQLTKGILSCLGLFLFCGRILLSCSGWP